MGGVWAGLRVLTTSINFRRLYRLHAPLGVYKPLVGPSMGKEEESLGEGEGDCHGR